MTSLVRVRVTRERERADEWALVLASAGITAQRNDSADGWELLVPASAAGRAGAVLDAYDEENRAVPQAAVPVRDYGPTAAALVVAVGLLVFFVATGPRGLGSFWFQSGAASAARIQQGELWRTVTALTLHADFVHVASNAVIGAIFGTALCAAVGPGVGLWLMLLAGAGGNLLNAALRSAGHSAVGASTAIFGAVGALAALQIVRRRRVGTSTWRAWAPLGAALALLAFLGSNPSSDVFAHLFGFAAGAGLGFAAAHALPEPPPRGVQRALAAAAALALLACWLLAVRNAP